MTKLDIKKLTHHLTLRPIPEFLEFARFKIPKSFNSWIERLKINGEYYVANYLILLALSLVYVGYVKPPFFFSLIFILASGTFLFVTNAEQIIQIGSTRITETQKIAGWSGITAILLFFFGGAQVVTALGFSSAVILLHASFRCRSIKSRGTTFVHDVVRNVK